MPCRKDINLVERILLLQEHREKIVFKIAFCTWDCHLQHKVSKAATDGIELPEWNSQRSCTVVGVYACRNSRYESMLRKLRPSALAIVKWILSRKNRGVFPEGWQNAANLAWNDHRPGKISRNFRDDGHVTDSWSYWEWHYCLQWRSTIRM